MQNIDLKGLREFELAKGIIARAVTMDTMTVAYVKLAAGAVLPEHSHYQEQVVNVIEGELELTVAGQPFTLVPGKVMVLEPNVVHSGKAKRDCYVIDVFHPIREDFRRKSQG